MKNLVPFIALIFPFGSLVHAQTPRILTTDSANVTTSAMSDPGSLLEPDPAAKAFARQDLLDANPGRPGAPVSIPGYPAETASSGIKAPQYFAPGVAGDHGEPIAQYLAVGSYHVPNNLSANAHGNGYSDPNLLIAGVLSSVAIDSGAFSVLEGNHAVNLAATYALLSRVTPFITLTGDLHDGNLEAGFSPNANGLVAVEVSVGNGLMHRLEHRQQFKLNAQQSLALGHHQVTMLGMAYYGSSYLAGLVPIFTPTPSDTLDPRQHDQTHSALVAANDSWTLTPRQQLHVSGFFRTENLAILSNFGQGLIRQSEFRTVTGQSTRYENRLSTAFSLLAGLDYGREAPRRDNLDRYGNYAGSLERGSFTKVDSNNLTITSWTPYAAGTGHLSPYFRYYAGWRRDEIRLVNDDLMKPSHSSDRTAGVNSPKVTLAFVPKSGWFVPLVAASFGQAFFTTDPRIGIGTTIGSPIATAHSYQLVAEKSVAKTEIRLTLGHVTRSQQLAKIDPDTGLQQDQGPARMRFLTLNVRQEIPRGSLLVTFSKADARDLDSGLPTPEAPRTLFDLTANQRLPFGVLAKGGFEFVGRKPLGTGCLPLPDAECPGKAVREARLSITRVFQQERLTVGLDGMLASGFTGQTTEQIGEFPTQQVVGVRIPSYASVSASWRFGSHRLP